MAPSSSSWHGGVNLRFHCRTSDPETVPQTRHQGGATAPLKLQRAFHQLDGRCELPILHTAGGLVGGDRLSLELHLEAGSRVLLTSVAAQKVYGSIGRSRQAPEGRWAEQTLTVQLEPGADLEWLPQELVVYADGLFCQRTRVELAPGASWLGADLVRLGRTAAGETLGAGCWRSQLEILRTDPDGPAHWELVDRLELAGATLTSPHGLAGEPVVGSLVWVAPHPLDPTRLTSLLEGCRADRRGIEGTMACGALEQGLVARFRGRSSAAGRQWFGRLWARVRREQGLPAPQWPRVWPFQEEPLPE
jgi:urease accessory protein